MSDDIFKFVGQKFENFEAITVSSQVVSGTNYKVTYNVTRPGDAEQGDRKVVVVTMFKPLPTKELSDPKLQIKSVLLPNGILHKTAVNGNDDDEKTGLIGGRSNWKTNMDSGEKKMFKNFQNAIEKFHGNKKYGTEFIPLRYKT